LIRSREVSLERYDDMKSESDWRPIVVVPTLAQRTRKNGAPTVGIAAGK
jgi:hypothetical protein